MSGRPETHLHQSRAWGAALALFAVLGDPGCFVGATNPRVLDADEVIQGTSFKEGAEVKTRDDGTLEWAVLGADQPVADVRFADSFPHVFPKGSSLAYEVSFIGVVHEVPDKIELAAPMTFMGVELPARTELVPGVVDGTIDGQPHVEVAFVQARLGGPATVKGKALDSGTYIQIQSPQKILLIEGTNEIPLGEGAPVGTVDASSEPGEEAEQAGGGEP